MDIEKIKEIPISGYLESKGVTPNKKKGNALYYCAFWRGGDNPLSVQVDTKKNIWFDYVAGEGGSIIDLVMKVEKCDNATAMKVLTDGYGVSIPITAPTFEEIPESKEAGIKVTKVRELYYYPLKSYMAERGISESVARKYCKEVRYTFGDSQKEGFGVGFPTISGSWVIRNKMFKGCTAQDISLISIPGSTALMVFEGFIDFLSYVEMYGTPKVSVLVLNSVANIKRAYTYFEAVERVYLLLDNDVKGREVTANITAIYGEKVVDKSAHFAPYKDFNEYLKKGGKNG